MRSAKLFGLILIAALGPLTFAHAEQREALLLQAPTPKIQNFSPVQAVYACHWTCSGVTTEILCPSGTHCSCTCTMLHGPLCSCVVPP
jgi:hypothetical protein